MTLREYLNKLIPSDRLLVVDEQGNELFRGFGTLGKYVKANLNAEVVGYGISTETFKRRTSRDEERKPRQRVEPETDYKFSDLEFHVFNKVIVKGEKHEERAQEQL